MKVINVKQANNLIDTAKCEKILEQELRIVKNPQVIVNDEKAFYVAEGFDKVGIVREKKKDLQPAYLYQMDNDKIHKEEYETEGYSYCMLDGELGQRSVSAFDINSHDECSLSVIPNKVHLRKFNVFFNQYQSGTDTDLQFQYNVEDLERLEDIIDYCNNHIPNAIRLETVKMMFNHFVYKKYLYGLGVDGKTYYAPLFRIGDYVFGTSPISYSSGTIYSKIADRGLYTEIPDELITLMNGTNKEYNKLKLVNDYYKESIKKK